ncbi:HNH endonuclease signature motif containing protein [Microbacterium paludicola]|uniref:HNH endonuclease signature motif containing protein n=1 Tax=Microbacterium paludicola TaxID=300019 RepID=UPI0011A451E1|nr:HNH endonuclease signature motif containing protein [Microbacterium paludicola]
MASLTDVATLIPTLCGQLVDGDGAEVAQARMLAMSDAEVVRVLQESAALAGQVEQIQVAAAGVIALRSSRERGHSGLSASLGHRSAAALIQDVTGSTKAEANRSARVGEALLDGDDARHGASGVGVPDAGSDQLFGADGVAGADGEPKAESPRALPWFQPLKDALRDSRLTSAQFDAIKRGLGEPPEVGVGADDDSTDGAQEPACAAWSQAAEHLIDEAGARTVEELWQAARSVRDLLDPEGAEARFLERFEGRSFRTYRGQDGRKRASIAFDDEGDLFIESMIAAALRPRRGGPRFVDPDEKAAAASLADDARTNEQLAYDLLIDVIRAGAIADAESVFGARQPGVRLVQVMDAAGTRAPIVHSEDHLVAMPGAVADQHICDTGVIPVTVDACANPLDVGREQRLFTPKQRVALAIRDGGCRWHGCDRPASYGEAHHIDEWKRDRGRTDIDRGILLCRYHHMTLHHGGWRITRDGKDDFVLHHPSGERFAMRSRAVLRYAFGDIDPSPRRFRPVA